MKIELILTQTVEQLEHMNEALAALRRQLLPGQPKKFAILAEGPLEEIRRLQAEAELLTTQIATAAPWLPKRMIKELDGVVLTTDLPEHGLAKDDIGTVVLVHEGGKGCTVEFMTLAGKTIAVVTLLANQVRSIAKDEIAHARSVAIAS